MVKDEQVKYKKCVICNKQIKNKTNNSRYCGDQKEKIGCAFLMFELSIKFSTLKQRCTNPNHQNFRWYKNKKISKIWLKDPKKFIMWSLKNGFKHGLQIDRIDNKKGYTPKNCRYVTPAENQRHKTNIVTDFENKKRRCSNCKEVKPFSEFYKNGKTKNSGITYRCNLCSALYQKQWKLSRKRREFTESTHGQRIEENKYFNEYART